MGWTCVHLVRWRYAQRVAVGVCELISSAGSGRTMQRAVCPSMIDRDVETRIVCGIGVRGFPSGAEPRPLIGAVDADTAALLCPEVRIDVRCGGISAPRPRRAVTLDGGNRSAATHRHSPQPSHIHCCATTTGRCRTAAGSYSAGLSVGGSHAPVVKSWRRASSLSSPHLVAVSR